MQEKVVGIGMSGGVDSSVAAYLLKKQGYKVIGITMQFFDDEKSRDSIVEAQKIASFLGIEHHVLDLRSEFRKIVIKDFIDSYKMGVTPNPCVTCNKYFKFGLFYKKAQELGCNYIATGHYAKVIDGKLYRADVKQKDQSYFLYAINKDVLKNVIFPLQGYSNKEEIRSIAREIGLWVSDKRDSQEICFIPNDDYKTFLSKEIEEDNTKSFGNICLEDGTVLGKHQGLTNYTIGQRKGLNISYSEPLYVLKIDMDNNCLIVGPNSSLFKNKLVARNINLLVDSFQGQIYAKVRSRGEHRPCEVEFKDDKAIVSFYNDERAITPGQSVVFYDADDRCLGGGIIEESIN